MYLLLSKSIAIEQQSRDGLKIKCADGRYRHCFPIITGIIADYEEQVLLTGVKSGLSLHCLSGPSFGTRKPADQVAKADA